MRVIIVANTGLSEDKRRWYIQSSHCVESGKCSRKAKPAMRMIMKMTLRYGWQLTKGGEGEEEREGWSAGWLGTRRLGRRFCATTGLCVASFAPCLCHSPRPVVFNCGCPSEFPGELFKKFLMPKPHSGPQPLHLRKLACHDYHGHRVSLFWTAVETERLLPHRPLSTQSPPLRSPLLNSQLSHWLKIKQSPCICPYLSSMNRKSNGRFSTHREQPAELRQAHGCPSPQALTKLWEITAQTGREGRLEPW